MQFTLDGMATFGPELSEEQLDQVTGGIRALDVVVIIVLIAFFP